MKNYINLVEQFTTKGQIWHTKRNITVKERSFASKCLFEVYSEYKEAKRQGNKEEMLDAFIDICYFACYCAIMFNLKGACIEYQPKEIKPLQDVLSAINVRDKKGLVWLLTNAYYSAKSEAQKIADYQGAFKHVHQCNMNKYTTNGPNAIIGAGLAKQGKKLDAKYERVNGYYIIYAIVDKYKRILKPSGWIAPKLGEYLK